MVVGEPEDGHLGSKLLVVHAAIGRPTTVLLSHEAPDGPGDAPVLRRLVDGDAVFDGVPALAPRVRITGVRRPGQCHQRLQGRKHQVIGNGRRIREDGWNIRVLPGTWDDPQVGVVIQEGQLRSQVVQPGARTGQQRAKGQKKHAPHGNPHGASACLGETRCPAEPIRPLQFTWRVNRATRSSPFASRLDDAHRDMNPRPCALPRLRSVSAGDCWR